MVTSLPALYGAVVAVSDFPEYAQCFNAHASASSKAFDNAGPARACLQTVPETAPTCTRVLEVPGGLFMSVRKRLEEDK